MAMLEHECRECNHFWSNNEEEFGCPKCGHSNVRSTSDEGGRARGRVYAPRRRSRIRRDEFGNYEEY